MMKKVIFLLIPMGIFAQNKSFDAAKTQERITQYIFSKPDSARIYLDIMLKNNHLLHDTVVAKNYNNFGVYYSLTAKHDSAKIFFNKAVSKYAKYPKNKAGSFINLSIAHRNTGDYKTSLEYLDDALKIYESLDNERGKAIVYGEMASNYAYMIDNKSATRYLLKGIEILSKSDDKTDRKNLVVQKQKLANIYFKLENFKFAIDLYEECLPAMKEVKDLKNYYLTLINYGDCLTYVKDNTKAKKALMEAAKGLEDFHNAEFISLAYSKLGKIALHEKKYDLSGFYYKKAFDGIKNTDSFRFMLIGAEYIQLLNQIGDFEKALGIIKLVENSPNRKTFNAEDQMFFYEVSAVTFKNTNIKDKGIEALEKAIIIKDSLAKAHKESTTEELQAKFQTQTQQEKNLFLKQKNELLSQKVSAQRRNYILIGSGIVVICALGFAISRAYWLKHKLEKAKLREAEIEKMNLLERNAYKKRITEDQQQIIQLREQELTSITLQLANLQDQISSIIENESSGTDSKSNSVKSSLQQIIKQKDYWKEFSIKFGQIHPNFNDKLQERFPVLTKNDINFCSLLKLNLSNKEIATLLQISHESVITKKYRIKKKINIQDDNEFQKIISEI
ncbi:tetratricopeptide repeat protein [Flavobacterium lindanitolerans]|jgi:tetratricopeptide (TPR) repeat protein/DNA-binding CsgD family transcriptional regulator|uniref:tetratricopeptide repeat protein n=1 Tax=Flavobacterium lindanitolerans TaxID=428988 RepID=UPI0027B89C0A|nr:tetratricopeptide repeat protein [Flavobacterium lindanitolerans]